MRSKYVRFRKMFERRAYNSLVRITWALCFIFANIFFFLKLRPFTIDVLKREEQFLSMFLFNFLWLKLFQSIFCLYVFFSLLLLVIANISNYIFFLQHTAYEQSDSQTTVHQKKRSNLSKRSVETEKPVNGFAWMRTKAMAAVMLFNVPHR